jgi:hypothetical protein
MQQTTFHNQKHKDYHFACLFTEIFYRNKIQYSKLNVKKHFLTSICS